MLRCDINSLAGALAAAHAGDLELWLHDFLKNGYTPNELLSLGLQANATATYLGPALFPLDQLNRIAGPEPGLDYHEPKSQWDREISLLKAKINEGWQPQPLLVSEFGGHPITIRDGSHRAEALRQSGASEYWTIFFFPDEAAKQAFTAAHPGLSV